MKNSELIDQLKKLDPDLPVYLSYHYGVIMRAEKVEAINILEVKFGRLTHYSRVEVGGKLAIVLEQI